MDIGPRTGVTMPGCQDAGTVRLMKGPIGTTRTTITSGKAGNCTKATGITRTTTGITETMAKTTDTTAIINRGAVRQVGLIRACALLYEYVCT